MKTFAKLLCIFGLLALASAQINDGPNWCTSDQRGPVACAEIYQHVVGFTAKNTFYDFGNACEACSNEEILKYYDLHHCPGPFTKIRCIPNGVKICALEHGHFKQYDDHCDACWSGRFQEYFFGDCPKYKVLGHKCTKKERLVETNYAEAYEPVCAKLSDGNKQTYFSGTLACADSNVVSYSEGECLNDVHVCTAEDREMPPCMTLMYDPHCGLKFDGSWQTYSAGCNTCQDYSVVFYIKGECPVNPWEVVDPIPVDPFPVDPIPVDPIICPPYVPEAHVCTEEEKAGYPCMTLVYDPVCATFEDGTQQTLGAGCQACPTKGVVSYVQGECAPILVDPRPVDPILVDPIPVDPIVCPPYVPEAHVCTEEEKAGYPCMTLVYDPVCATFEDGTQQTLGAGCQACPTKGVVSYVQGECVPVLVVDPAPVDPIFVDPIPVQQVHICTEEEKTGYPCQPFVYAPVCGTFEDGTQQTFVADCAACPNKGVVSYVDGECAPILIVDPAPFEPIPYVPEGVHVCTKEEKNDYPCQPFVYAPVCGTHEDGSRQTYVADCAACPSEGVISYVDGECPVAEPPVILEPLPYIPYDPVITLPYFPDPTPVQAIHFCTEEEKTGYPCQPFRYAPVCGTHEDGSRQTYVADCAACPSKGVVSYVDGECEAYVQPIPTKPITRPIIRKPINQYPILVNPVEAEAY